MSCVLCRCGRFRSVAVSLALPYRRETLTTSVLHLGSAERRGRYTQMKPRSKPAGAFSYWPMGQPGFPAWTHGRPRLARRGPFSSGCRLGNLSQFTGRQPLAAASRSRSRSRPQSVDSHRKNPLHSLPKTGSYIGSNLTRGGRLNHLMPLPPCRSAACAGSTRTTHRSGRARRSCPRLPPGRNRSRRRRPEPVGRA